MVETTNGNGAGKDFMRFKKTNAEHILAEMESQKTYTQLIKNKECKQIEVQVGFISRIPGVKAGQMVRVVVEVIGEDRALVRAIRRERLFLQKRGKTKSSGEEAIQKKMCKTRFVEYGGPGGGSAHFNELFLFALHSINCCLRVSVIARMGKDHQITKWRNKDQVMVTHKRPINFCALHHYA